MTDREKDVFNLGAPKVIETIRNDWEKELEKNHSFIVLIVAVSLNKQPIGR